MPVTAVDNYARQAKVGGDGFGRAVAVTPSNSDELAEVSSGILSTAGGTCTMTLADGGTFQLTLAANTIYNLRVRKVASTGTAATGIWALYQ